MDPSTTAAATPAEEAVLVGIATGETVDLAPGPVEFTDADAWGEARSVRAAWLASTLAAAATSPKDSTSGLTVRGARLTGPAAWNHRIFGLPLTFLECWFDTQGPLSLAHATVHSLVLRGCRTKSINAHRLLAAHHVVFGDCDIRGSVDVSDARIDGTWKLSGSSIAPTEADLERDRWAVSADGAVFGGNIMFDGASVTGDLSLRMVRVSGGVSGLAATLTQSSFAALNLDGAQIGGDVFLGGGGSATGEVRMREATVEGQIGCRGGRFVNLRAVYDMTDEYALNLSAIRVRGDVHLEQGYVQGGLRLLGADIGGQLSCNALRIESPHTRAVSLEQARIGGNVLFDQGFDATGSLELIGTQVDGSLALRSASIRGGTNGVAINAKGLHVEGVLSIRDLLTPVEGMIDLTRVSVAELDDDATSWPARSSLRLRGFTYTQFSADAPQGAAERLKWLALQDVFAPQPYEQLIAVYRASGQEREARAVAMAKQEALRKAGGLGRRGSAWNWIVGRAIGHGYQPWRAAWYLLALYAVTLVVVLLSGSQDLFIATNASSGTNTTSSHCSQTYPCFSPPVYAAEVTMPILNLHQTAFWQPDAHTGRGRGLQTYLAIATPAGWGLTTLAVVAFTGLARRE